MDFLHYSITIIKVLPYRLQCYIIAKCIVTYMSHICLLPAGLYMQLQNPQLFIHRSYIYTSLTISKRACEKTKVFSCVLLLMDVIVVILHKKGYSPPYPIRMLSYELLCGSCYFFLFIVIFIKIVSDRNEKYFKQYRFYSSSDNSFVPPVVFHDTKGPFCLNGSVHP